MLQSIFMLSDLFNPVFEGGQLCVLYVKVGELKTHIIFGCIAGYSYPHRLPHKKNISTKSFKVHVVGYIHKIELTSFRSSFELHNSNAYCKWFFFACVNDQLEQIFYPSTIIGHFTTLSTPEIKHQQRRQNEPWTSV